MGSAFTFAPAAVLTQSPPLADLLFRAAQSTDEFAKSARGLVCEERTEQSFVKPRMISASDYFSSASDYAPLASRVVVAFMAISAPAPDDRSPWRESIAEMDWGEMRPAGPMVEARELQEVATLAAALTARPRLPRLSAVLLHGSIQPFVDFADRGQTGGTREVKVSMKAGSPLAEFADVRGTLWIDPSTARVTKSVLKSGKGDSTEELTVTYGTDQGTGLWLPIRVVQMSRSDLHAAWWMEAHATIAGCQIKPLTTP